MKPAWLQSRTVRKFVRNRLAVGALLVISVYLIVALAILCRVITLDQTEQRVGPGSSPGLWGGKTPETRLEDQVLYLETVEQALRQQNPLQAIAETTFGNLRFASRPAAELDQLVQHGWQLYEQLVTRDNLNNDPALVTEVERFEQHVGRLFQPMSTWERIGQRWLLLLGTDRQGRSILQRAIYSVKVALQIGLVTALISVACGSLLGAAAAFYGGVVDHAVIWLYSTLSSIPNLVLLVLLAYLFTGTTVEDTHPLIPVYAAFCLTYWIGPCRVVRGETLKIKELEYIQAATTVGFSRFYILLRHILPNTAHLILVNFSLLFIGAVKSEVILSFLGLGVKHGPSWGIMISHAKSEVVNGFFWQIGTATAFMFVLVLAFNILTDALQDAFDPKHL